MSASSGAISAEVSIGDGIAGGVGEGTPNGVEGKLGYTGQLYDTRIVQVLADPSMVTEKTTTQLTAVATLDDDTLLELAGGEVNWSVIDGPIVEIDVDGLATAGEVFLNSLAEIRGSYQGVKGDLGITVLNLNMETPGGSPPPLDFVGLDFDPAQAGRYQGVVRNTGGDVLGFVTGFRLNPLGGFSGRMIFGGRSYRLRGSLESDGSFTGQVLRRNQSPLEITLAIGRTLGGTGGLTLLATVSVDGLMASGPIDQAPYHARNNPAPSELVKSYTFLIPAPETGSSNQPGGDGFGSARVLSSGTVIAMGKTGDGTRFSTRGFLTEDGQWYLYQPLYRGQGLIAGTISFRDVPEISDLDGQLDWVKNPNPRERKYPGGFDLPPWLVGSQFDPPSRGERTLAELADEEYNARLTLAGNSLAEGGFAKVISWQSNHSLVYYGPERLRARANPRNGLINGSYFDPLSRTRVGFGGAVLQKQAIAGGNFLFANEAGYLLVEPGTDYFYPGSEDAGALGLAMLPGDSAPDPNLVPVTNFDSASAGLFGGTIAVDGSGEFFGGLQNVRLAANGAISGQIWIEGKHYGFRGRLDDSGSAQIEVIRRGQDPVLLTLQLSLADGTSDGFALAGEAEIDGIAHQVGAQRRPSYNRDSPASEAGRYTMAMKAPDLTDPANEPGGDGYGSVNVLFNGLCRGLLILADGSRASMSGHLSRSGEWSVYRSLYGRRGYLAGKLTFRDVPGVSDVDGECRWYKEAGVPRTPNYANGFDVARAVIGGTYTPPGAGEIAFAALDPEFYNAWMRLQGPDLSPSTATDIEALDRAVTWNEANRILYYGPERAVINFNRNTGMVSGRYIDRANAVNVRFGGALLQEQALLTGSYLAGDRSGIFTIAPR